MIRAVFIVDKGRFRSFSVKGHAEFDSSGKDIVCASVSAVTIMAANTITEIHKAETELKSSDAEINLHLKEQTAESENLIEGLFMFLDELSQQYSEYLSVSIQKGEKHND